MALEDTKQGWLFSLRDEESSAWGSPEDLLEELQLNSMRKDVAVRKTDVYGRLPKTPLVPAAGHGIAFYHSTRAYFPPGNPYRKKPRISLVGEIASLDPFSAEDDWTYPLELRFEKWAVASIVRQPLVRSDDTLDVFEGAGIVRGAVRTWYYAPPAVWKLVLRHLRRHAA